MAFVPRAAAFGLLAVSFCVGLPSAGLADDLVLKRVLLSSGGVGYFEHEAQIADDGTLRLDVPLDQVDDVLKSIVVFDDKSGVGTVRLPGREPLEQLFRELPIGQDAFNSAPELLAALKGSPVTVSGKPALSGRLVAVEAETVALPDGAGSTTRHRVSLMTVDGVQQFLLEEQDAVRFADPALESAVAAALEGFAAHRVRDRRTLEIEARGTSERRVRVGYVVGAPLWKASYRLTLGEGNADLQGWAHLENLSGQAWNGVELTLVAGNPVTFRQALATAYFVDRPEVPVEVLGRVLPSADDGAVALGGAGVSPIAGKLMARAERDRVALASGQPEAAADYAEAAPAPAPLRVAQGAIATAREEAATQVILHIAEPITLAPGQSLTVPVIDATVRLHDEEAGVARGTADLVLRAAQIGLAIGLHHDVEQRRHGALIFSVFRQHDRRERDEHARVPRGDQRADALFVRVIGVGMQQADADAAHALRYQLVDRGERRLLVQRGQHAALEIEPLGHFANEMQRHQARRLDPEIRVAIAVRHGLARDFDDVAGTFGDQQAEALELLLEHRVGRGRRAMQHGCDLAGLAPGGMADLADTVEQPLRGVAGRGRRLHRSLIAACLVDRDNVGECAAGVDRDPQAHRALLSTMVTALGDDAVKYPV